MHYYKLPILTFKRKVRDDKKCEDCKTRFNCIRYVAIKYVEEKNKIKKINAKILG